MSVSTTHTDIDLFARIANGDEEAFRLIFHEYNGTLFHTVLKIVKIRDEAKEIIQELFLKLWLNRNSLSEIKNPGGWLQTVAANLCVDFLRKKSKAPGTIELSTESGSTSDVDPLYMLESKQVTELIQEAVSRLPSSRKKIFELSRNQGLSRSEIALKLNISESTVKNQLTASLKFVQDYLIKHGNLHLLSGLAFNLTVLFCV